MVNNMPLIGPIRVQITKELKKTLDKLLGPQVKTFLASFNRVAVQRMIDFVLRDDNKKAFAKANRNLIDSLLSRKLSELLPDERNSSSLRVQLLSSVRQISSKDAEQLVDLIYEQMGDKRVSDVIDVDLFLRASPTAKLAAQTVLNRYFAASSVQGQPSSPRQ